MVLADAPTAYWRLDDTGSLAADVSGNGLTGTISSGVTKMTPGLLTGNLDTAMTFDGSTGWLNMGNPSGLIPSTGNGLSFEFWAAYTISNVVNGTWVGGRCSIYPGFNVGDLSYGVELSFNIAGDITFEVSRDGSANLNISPSRRLLTSPLAYNDGKPHHIVGTYGVPTAPQVISLYIDGGLISSASFNGGGGNPVWAPYAGTSNVQFAKPPTNGFGQTYFPGTLDEIAVYNYALTAQQVFSHYQVGKATKFAVVAPSRKSTFMAVPE
jgi:hypothetical protein